MVRTLRAVEIAPTLPLDPAGIGLSDLGSADRDVHLRTLLFGHLTRVFTRSWRQHKLGWV